MRYIVIEGGNSVEIWEQSSFRGYILCGYRTEWLLEISDRGLLYAQQSLDLLEKNEKQLVTITPL